MSGRLAWPVYTLDGWQGNVMDDWGANWVITAVTGWDDPPAPRLGDVARPDRDGDYPGLSTYGPRVIGLTGTCDAISQVGMLEAKERMLAAAPFLDSEYQFQVQGRDMTRICNVIRGDTWKVTDRGPLAFDFQMVLKARDPRKYAGAISTVDVRQPAASSSVPGAWPFPWPLPWHFAFTSGEAGYTPVVNAGNYRSYPTLTIPGPVAYPRIENRTTGDAITVGVVLADTDVLTIECYSGAVILNGAASRQSLILSGSQFPSLVPGTNVLTYRASSPTSSIAALSFRSAWM